LIDVSLFKKQALEVNERLQKAQEEFGKSLDIIQKQYIIISDSLKVIVDRESDLSVAKHKVREVISWK
jgi:hypothetical protein